MLRADAIGPGKARRLRGIVTRRGQRRGVLAALVGHGAYFVLDALSVVVLGVELGGVDDVVSELELLAPLGVDDDETVPLADIDPEVEVSADGVVDVLELLGDDVSVEAVVVAGVVVVVVVELGMAFVPELL
jgi:hypothetical protein